MHHHLPVKISRRRSRRGFTLVELLVVVAIIALLIGILLPTLKNAREVSKRVACLSNLHQMIVAANTYLNDYKQSYPIAYTSPTNAWDFTTITSGEKVPGILWGGDGNAKVQQCPSFAGAANWQNDPYTGYNYNTSYIGHGVDEAVVAPAKSIHVKKPEQTALFGDGQYDDGANKFMRAPWPNPGDVTFSGRYAGTQGYRHLDLTNTAFCDGHADSLKDRFLDNADGADNVTSGTGFLSADNNLYDLQ